MSETALYYQPDLRRPENAVLRKAIDAGAVLAQRAADFIVECQRVNDVSLAKEEMEALANWNATLAELRGEVQP